MNVESCSKLSNAVHVMGVVIQTLERWEEGSPYFKTLSRCTQNTATSPVENWMDAVGWNL